MELIDKKAKRPGCQSLDRDQRSKEPEDLCLRQATGEISVCMPVYPASRH